MLRVLAQAVRRPSARAHLLPRATFSGSAGGSGSSVDAGKKLDAQVSEVLPQVIVSDDEELQGHWRSMEHRVSMRRTKKDGPRGRKGLRPSAWDHENV